MLYLEKKPAIDTVEKKKLKGLKGSYQKKNKNLSAANTSSRINRNFQSLSLINERDKTLIVFSLVKGTN